MKNFITIVGTKGKIPDAIYLNNGKNHKFIAGDDVIVFLFKCIKDNEDNTFRLEKMYILAELSLNGWEYAEEVGKTCFEEWDQFISAVKNKQYKHWEEFQRDFL